MGERVRSANKISDVELEEVETALEHWLEDRAAGATVQMTIDMKASGGKKGWMPRGFPLIVGRGPELVLRLMNTLLHERQRTRALVTAARQILPWTHDGASHELEAALESFDEEGKCLE